MASTSKVSLPLLDDNSYTTWAVRMEAALACKALDGAIADGGVPPESDKLARGLIILHLKDHLYPFVKKLDTAKAVWDKLEALYKARSKARINQLRRELAGLRKLTGESVTKYVARAEGLRDQLLQAGDELESGDIISSVLNGLPREYHVAVQILEASSEELSLSDILSRLLQAEHRLRKDDLPSEGDASAYAGMVPPRVPTAGFKKLTGDNKERRSCYYCGKPGHIAKDCRKKKRDKGGPGASADAAPPSAMATPPNQCCQSFSCNNMFANYGASSPDFFQVMGPSPR